MRDLDDLEAVAKAECLHFYGWSSPAGSVHAAHICMSCHTPDPDWLNELHARVRTAEAERDEAIRTRNDWASRMAEFVAATARAEAAEAKVARVEALADSWDRDAATACDGANHSGCPDCSGGEYAAALRAALNGDPS